jgi:hypothetical protein
MHARWKYDQLDPQETFHYVLLDPLKFLKM